MEALLLTIVVTVYNKEKTLKRCFDSILKNDMLHSEILVINDGSTDHSAKIIEEYAKKYPFIRVKNNYHKGLGAIRKTITPLIRSQYFLYVDADDTITEDLLFRLTRCIEKYHPDCIKFDINERNSSKNKKRYILKKEKVYESGYNALLEWNECSFRYGLFSMYCFKKEIMQKTRKYFYTLKCYEDVANIPKMIYFSNKVVSLSYIGYNYFRTKNSITNYMDKKEKFLQFQKACDNLFSFFKNRLNEEDELYQKIEAYYSFHLTRKKKELLVVEEET